jgi:amidase
VPMMNGASTLEGYTPDIDATIVTRILDAGGTIVGKAHCEYFCFSGGSHTGALGPVHNPLRMGYSAGGSSSGSAALLAAGEVDMAIGGDQGGSIRMPSSYCGVYGMKPTHGLVPYTGVMPIEITLDHTGPMTRNVADNALLLEVLAGEDGLDPRQYNVKTEAYTKALDGGAKGLRIGIVKEGFNHPNSERDVDAKVKQAATVLRDLGATVSEISVPMHAVGGAIWSPIALEGATELMMRGNGMGTNWRGLYTTSLLDAHSAWKHRADYDAALAQVDLLIMPTLPLKATPLPPPDAPRALYIQRAFEMLANTAPFDATGHPAMSVPCGLGDGLPVGLMIIGKHYDEATIYRAAAAFERDGDWKKM